MATAGDAVKKIGGPPSKYALGSMQHASHEKQTSFRCQDGGWRGADQGLVCPTTTQSRAWGRRVRVVLGIARGGEIGRRPPTAAQSPRAVLRGNAPTGTRPCTHLRGLFYLAYTVSVNLHLRPLTPAASLPYPPTAFNRSYRLAPPSRSPEQLPSEPFSWSSSDCSVVIVVWEIILFCALLPCCIPHHPTC